MATKFEYKKSLAPNCSPILVSGENTIIANSETVKIGDAVKWDTDGFTLRAAATNKVLGIVVGVCDKNGLALEPTSGLDTYTVDADNETVDKVRLMIDVSKDSLYKNDSSGSLAQTNIGQFFDLTDQDQINQGSASDTSGQFQLIALDPDNEGDASMGLFRIAESQLDPFAQA